MPRYSLNARDLVAKTVDDETVLINLATGVYYSTAGSGAVAFAQLTSGADSADVATGLARAYGVDVDAVAGDLDRFLSSLLEEGILVEDDSAVVSAPEVPPTAGPYAAPELDVYTDMGDLLALDPPMPGLQDIPWEPPSS